MNKTNEASMGAGIWKLVEGIQLFKKIFSDVSYLMIPVFGFHSCANAFTVMLVITPYRNTLFRWARKVFRNKAAVAPVLVADATTSSSNPPR